MTARADPPGAVAGGCAQQTPHGPGRVAGSRERLGQQAQQPSPDCKPPNLSPLQTLLEWGGRCWSGGTSCRPRSEGGGRLGPSGCRGTLGSFREVLLCGCWGCEPRPSPLCLLSAGSRAPCLHAQGVLPAHQPPPALHAEAGPDPHGERGAGGRRGWGTQGSGCQHPTRGSVRSRVPRAVP